MTTRSRLLALVLFALPLGMAGLPHPALAAYGDTENAGIPGLGYKSEAAAGSDLTLPWSLVALDKGILGSLRGGITTTSSQGAQASLVSAANSSTTPLAGSATFTGTSEASLGYDTITMTVFTDQSGTLNLDQSSNGTNWDITNSKPISASAGTSFKVQVVGSFFRVRYINGSTLQTVLRLQTIKIPIQVVLPRALSTLGSLMTVVNEPLPSGSNVIGKTGIDQTTPGTTNAVQPATAAAGSPTANATAPFAVQVMASDGTNLQRLLTALALGDGVNGNNMLANGNWLWNGTGWDRSPGTTAGAKVTPNATEIHLGSVGGDLVTVGDNYSQRPANTTNYGQTNTYNISLVVSAATNATPIVLTTTAAHTLIPGDFVTVAGVTGNTAANGNWKVGAVGGSTITLLNPDGTNTTGNGSYVSGGTVAQILVFHIGRTNGGSAHIMSVKFEVNSITTSNGSFRIYFYNTPVTTAVDQQALTLLYANRASLLGYADLYLQSESATGADAAVAVTTGLDIPVVTDAYGNIYARMGVEAIYTPTSNELGYVEVTAERN